jgi:hypothetical protein
VSFFSGPPKSVIEAYNSSTVDMSSEERISIDGERRLKRIARAGKRWKQSIGRKIDLEGERLRLGFGCGGLLNFFFFMTTVYVYRLCLEWARLWADDRDSMDYLS